MARKPTGRPVGRTKVEINWEQFEQLCSLQCIQSEIASFLKIHPNTLSDRTKEHYGEDFSTIYKRFSDPGKCSLRRNQFVLSKKNATMAIWLGKIWLGQKDPSNDEAKEDMLHVLKSAIREIEREPRIDASSRSFMENKQSLLDKEHRGEQTEVLPKLGTENSLGESA